MESDTPRSTRRRRPGGPGRVRPAFERLERRELFAVEVLGISAIEGVELTLPVATFQPGDVQGTVDQLRAVIRWGDGQASPGRIARSGTPGEIAVIGDHVYAVQGQYPVAVTVLGAGMSQASGRGSATVEDAPLVATGTAITPVVGRPFDGVVASFVDAYPGLDAGAYLATIAWGDGTTSAGTIAAAPAGGFNVLGAHTYDAMGPNQAVVTVTRSLDGQSDDATTSVVVVEPALTAFGTTITPVVDQLFSGVVARFDDAGAAADPGEFVATIAWGDGATSTGQVVAEPSGQYAVIGAHTYETTGAFDVTVTIARAATGQSDQAMTDAVVVERGLTAQGTTITPLAGRPFEGIVASFVAVPPASAGEFTATIAWGDGTTSAGRIAAAPEPGRFLVVGSHTYPSPGAADVVVTVARSASNQMATATTNAVISVAMRAFSGALDPLSDSGRPGDNITFINEPVLRGTGEPFSIVQLFARPEGLSDRFPIGDTLVAQDGTWTLVAGPLPDGAYVLSATVLPTEGFPMEVLPLLPGGPLVIDTLRPRVVGLTPTDRRSGRLAVSFRDESSGMEVGTLLDPAHYAMLGAPPWRAFPAGIALRPTAAVLPTDPVVIDIDPGPGRRRSLGLRIVPGGITDVAGNPLDGPSHGGPVVVSLGAFGPRRRPRRAW
ncbi:Ig-like domain-containing protein [Tautonia plasticadhaerens]|uniref:Bacterial Ig-like domain-containing protein n=1 Tax=Tautonia plasticadhaerens TaxID=2527974 RepID=A0A518H9I6_9BACT|nr:Ig-like domain-containing protein [Tautonia plasticadhaerens]QDV37396.1 hypothetical protein ElP_53350 [Tautonia plasticadhaerens]